MSSAKDEGNCSRSYDVPRQLHDTLVQSWQNVESGTLAIPANRCFVLPPLVSTTVENLGLAMTDLAKLSATEISDVIRERRASAVEVCDAVLARIESTNPLINAIVQRTDDDARADARAVDQALASGEEPGPLAGVPVTIKVNIDQKGYATTNGLKTQSNLVAIEDSPVVSNLKRAGGVIVGRTNTPAFSLRWFTRNTLHGHTRNPVNSTLTPGGSSGGSAAAVASGMCAIGQGTDIGGSIRYPAYACGIQGIRPTLGRVAAANFSAPDRHIGAQLMAVSGPLARSISDLHLALKAMAAKDVRDPWWTPVPLNMGNYAKRAALTISPEGLNVQPAVEKALRDAAKRLQDAGWEVVEAKCPPFREAARLQALLWLAETRRAGNAMITREADPDAMFVYRQMQRLAPAPDLEGLLDALQRRVTLAREWNLFFDDYSVLICPVSAELPFRDQLDVTSAETFERIMEAQLTQVGLPLLGLPGLSVFTGMSEQVPCGVQLVGGRFREDVLFSAAAEIEKRGPAVAVADPLV
ncbi:MAG: amidase family protein [Hyphomicrobiaceae bacterium]